VPAVSISQYPFFTNSFFVILLCAKWAGFRTLPKRHTLFFGSFFVRQRKNTFSTSPSGSASSSVSVDIARYRPIIRRLGSSRECAVDTYSMLPPCPA
jgi:hypothetical protein